MRHIWPPANILSYNVHINYTHHVYLYKQGLGSSFIRNTYIGLYFFTYIVCVENIASIGSFVYCKVFYLIFLNILCWFEDHRLMCNIICCRSLMVGWRKKSWNPGRISSVVTLSICVWSVRGLLVTSFDLET